MSPTEQSDLPKLQMLLPPVPDNEALRLQTLRSLGLLDTGPKATLDAITALAAGICQTPIALITLVDEDRQWFLSRQGLTLEETSREIAFCAHAICASQPVMVVPSATSDSRFDDNPLVVGAPGIRFYAGAPLVLQGNHAIGTLCVIDRRERQLDETQLQMLRQLADLAEQMIARDQDHAELQRRRIEDITRQHEMLVASSAAGLDLKSLVDCHYVYQYVNRTYLDYWGQESSEIIGRTVPDLMGHEQFTRVVKPRLDRAMAGEAISYEAVIDFPRKGKRYLEVFYLPARNDQGQIVGTVVRGHDVTPLKLREQQLRDTVSMLEHKTLEQQRFIHIISHDLKEPVNSINNFSGLLQQDFRESLPAPAQRYVDFVHAGGRRMKVLLDDLTDLLVLDKHLLNLRETDLNDLLQQAAQDLHAALVRTGGNIEVESPLPVVRCDPTLLRIVLQNLLANALKFVTPGVQPRIRLSSERSDTEVKISVEDNGIGIPSDKFSTIFDMFQRLHTRKEYEGTGLGLSICRRIMDLHGGSIAIRSQPGAGSCFTIHLPLSVGLPTDKDTK